VNSLYSITEEFEHQHSSADNLQGLNDSSTVYINNSTALNTGIGLYGGLFHVTSVTQIFHMFIYLVSAIILQLTAFYPRKV